MNEVKEREPRRKREGLKDLAGEKMFKTVDITHSS
jgi:hypothetical protein